jgi:hypothetical protein
MHITIIVKILLKKEKEKRKRTKEKHNNTDREKIGRGSQMGAWHQDGLAD